MSTKDQRSRRQSFCDTCYYQLLEDTLPRTVPRCDDEACHHLLASPGFQDVIIRSTDIPGITQASGIKLETADWNAVSIHRWQSPWQKQHKCNYGKCYYVQTRVSLSGLKSLSVFKNKCYAIVRWAEIIGQPSHFWHKRCVSLENQRKSIFNVAKLATLAACAQPVINSTALDVRLTSKGPQTTMCAELSSCSVFWAQPAQQIMRPVAPRPQVLAEEVKLAFRTEPPSQLAGFYRGTCRVTQKSRSTARASCHLWNVTGAKARWHMRRQCCSTEAPRRWQSRWESAPPRRAVPPSDRWDAHQHARCAQLHNTCISIRLNTETGPLSHLLAPAAPANSDWRLPSGHHRLSITAALSKQTIHQQRIRGLCHTALVSAGSADYCTRTHKSTA